MNFVWFLLQASEQLSDVVTSGRGTCYCRLLLMRVIYGHDVKSMVFINHKSPNL